ncbi:MAG: DUF3575 domain-containing protein [Bacteroidota bacterium]
MQKRFFVLIAVISFSVSSHSQDVGYRTFDAGAEFQYVKDGPAFNLQLALNAEEHHSVILRGGYLKVSGKTTSAHNSEAGSGWGGAFGYRYYFSVLPKRFFIGARAALWSMNITWSVPEASGSSKLLLLQPAVETGYTWIINDYFFITPQLSASVQTTLSTKGEKVAYGTGFVPQAGISIGWRF